MRIVHSLACIALVSATLSPSASAKPTHPLDPLEDGEVARALRTLEQAGKKTATTLFPYVMLKEPPKREVLAFRPGQPFRREVLAVIFDRQQGKTFEATVDLGRDVVTQWQALPGVQPAVMLSEFDAVSPIVKADPRFRSAMARRGLHNLDEVTVDTWSYGNPDTALSRTARLLRVVMYVKGSGTNFYARPIDGLSGIVNMDTRRVEQLLDTEVLPVPPKTSELDAAGIGKPREAPRPLTITQPQGASFTVVGNEVRWQNWRFRYTMHPREGLVLQLVEYEDHGKRRPVLYRASLAEMMVPYGHTDPHWSWRSAFDEGEYGIGRYSGSLEVGTDVPSYATLFDAAFVDDFGKPYAVKNAVALYERDGGLLWKHFDMYTGKNESRRARDLVLGFITTISNYDYGISWIFHQDGSLELEAQLTGIMLAKGSRMTTMQGTHDSADMRFGHLVAPNVVAPHHQHFFNFRLDLDVDGADSNSLVELNTQALPPGPQNPAGNAFAMTESVLATERAAQRELDLGAQRKWKVVNTKAHNALGYSTGYILVPGESAVPYLQPDTALRQRGGFVNHAVWATPYRDDERFAAGTYPSQSARPDGLPVWTAQDRPLAGQDLVLWYTFCVTHAPRPEEWPIMNTHRIGFKLIPAGFFDRNPALDVPRPSGGP